MLATQTLPQMRPGTMAVNVEGTLRTDATAKDVILAHHRPHRHHRGAVGRIIEYRGPVIEALSMEGRMTVCNMSIEAGAKAGLIAPDETTFEYLLGRERAPSGELFQKALADWRSLRTDDRGHLRCRGDPRRRRHLPHGDLGHQPRPVGAAGQLSART